MKPTLPDFKKTKNLVRFLSCFLFVFSLDRAVAQGKKSHPDDEPFVKNGSPQTAKGYVLDAVDLQNGQVAVVGSSNRHAFLQVYDARNRKTVNPPIFHESELDEFRGVARTDEGHILAAGFTQKEGRRQGLLVEYLATGNWSKTVDSKIPALRQYSCLEKVAWFGGSDSCVIAATKDSEEGYVHILLLVGNKLDTLFSMGDGNFREIKNLFCSERGERVIWLCGNTHLAEGYKENKPWVARYSMLNGQLDTKKLDDNSAEPRALLLENACLTDAGYSEHSQCGIQLVGRAYSLPNNGQKSGWRHEVNVFPLEKSGKVKDYNIQTSFSYQNFKRRGESSPASAICQNARGQLFTAIGTDGNPSTQYLEVKEAAAKGGKERLESWEDQACDDDWRVAKIFPINSQEVLMVCNLDLSGAENAQFKIFHLSKQTDRDHFTDMKGRRQAGVKLERCNLVNDCLKTGPAGSVVSIQLKNEGEPLFYPVLYVIHGEKKTSLSVKISSLPSQKTTTSPTFTVVLPPGIAAGSTYDLAFSLRDENGQDVPLANHLQKLQVCSEKRAATGTLTWRKGDKNINYKMETASKNQEVRAELVTGHAVPKDSLVVKRKGLVLSTDNDRGSLFSNFKPSEPRQRDFFTEVTVHLENLEKGENRIELGYVRGGKDTFWFPETCTFSFSGINPNLYVLAIGPQYKTLEGNTDDTLHFVKNDVDAVIEMLKKQEKDSVFNEVFVKYLTGPQANENAIKRKFTEFIAQGFGPLDYILIYLSGHGSYWNPTAKAGFCFHPADFNDGQIKDTGIHFNAWIDSLKTRPGKKIYLIDACHSGLGAKSGQKPSASGALLEAMKILKGQCAFLSSSSDQLSYESTIWQHGLFTQALLEALRGQGVKMFRTGENLDPDAGFFDPETQKMVSENDRHLWVGELKNFLEKRVPDLMEERNSKISADESRGAQNPCASWDETTDGMKPSTVLFSLPPVAKK